MLFSTSSSTALFCPPPSTGLLAFLALLSAAFCCAFVHAQADSKLQDDLFLRNLLLRQYLLEAEQQPGGIVVVSPAADQSSQEEQQQQQRLLVPSSPAAAAVFGILARQQQRMREAAASHQQQQQQQQFLPLLSSETESLPRPRRTSGASKKRAAKLFRLSDQYTPTPCRWKLCASIFKAGDLFQRRRR